MNTVTRKKLLKAYQVIQERHTNERLWHIQRALQSITTGCREDMHEPDEQGISAIVTGDHLDNAFGMDRGSQEFVVTLDRDGRTARFNLADLIALARKAKLY